MEYTHVKHTFLPVYNEESRILILGSFPSVKSRENQFYYGHPQNRFWKVIAGIFKEPLPQTIDEKKDLLLRHRIAVWDVIDSCDIVGSSDSSIRNVVPNDMNLILSNAKIQGIFANGGKAHQLFVKYCNKEGMPPLGKLPSTSPANAAWNLERLTAEWKTAFGMYLEITEQEKTNDPDSKWNRAAHPATVDFLLEAVGIVAALVYLGLQIYYGIVYGVSFTGIILNAAILILVYVGLTLLARYPERVNNLPKEICSGKIRKYTIHMVRAVKLIFVLSLLFTSICDAAGVQINKGYSLVTVALIAVVTVVYEGKIIKLLRGNK